jgi:hypothetical protein
MHKTESEIQKLHMIFTPKTGGNIDGFGSTCLCRLPVLLRNLDDRSTGHVTHGFPMDKPVQTCE